MTGADEPRRARLVRSDELACLEDEGMTGIRCEAGPAGHAGPHRGWWRGTHDDTGMDSVAIVWPVPDRPVLVEPDGVDRLLGQIAWAMRSPRRVDELRPLLNQAREVIQSMRVGMNPHGLELSYVEGERDNLREVVAEAQRQRDVVITERDRWATELGEAHADLDAVERELHESVRGDGAPESATLADRVAAMRMAYVHRHNLAESLHDQVKAVRALAPPLSDARPGTLAERVQARIDAARTERFAMLQGSLDRHRAFRRRALDRERALKRLVHEREAGPRLNTSWVPTDAIREVLGWPQWSTPLFDDAGNETEPPSPSASTLLALVREALVDADAMGRRVAPEGVPAVVAGVLEELSRLRAATVGGVPVGTAPTDPGPDGERAVQCDSTWPLRPTPETGHAACHLMLDHYGLHMDFSGRTWADETMGPENVAAPRPRLDRRPSCPVCGEPSPDHEVGECDDAPLSAQDPRLADARPTPERAVNGVRSDPGLMYRPEQTVTIRLDDATVRAIERTIARVARRG